MKDPKLKILIENYVNARIADGAAVVPVEEIAAVLGEPRRRVVRVLERMGVPTITVAIRLKDEKGNPTGQVQLLRTPDPRREDVDAAAQADLEAAEHYACARRGIAADLLALRGIALLPIEAAPE